MKSFISALIFQIMILKFEEVQESIHHYEKKGGGGEVGLFFPYKVLASHLKMKDRFGLNRRGENCYKLL